MASLAERLQEEWLTVAKTLHTFTISTHEKQSFTNLDSYLDKALKESGVQAGIMIVFCPHTTGAITINENADPDVKTDLKRGLDETFPNKPEYVHMEGNSDGHMKSSVVGVSETLIISDGRLILGTWQSVYFCEFDGPRTRKVHVKMLEG
ncbi:secondary thiamine-phosphate synthase enzyme YjbQ [Lentibacillus salinarum]|uniref:Secondary thiamine-phosphate synthase enzyme YjbQ n=1 Tax=Lentibacillus salinarum TaxID=446820 RepID=A0ABW3ZYS4_9BACI